MHRTLSSDAINALQSGDITALIAHHRRTFGGYVMEDAPAGDPASTDPADTDPAGDPNEDPAEDPNEDEDARVKRANRQAAQYRTQLRETQQQLQQLTEAQTANAGVLEALRAALNPGTDAGDGDDPAEVARQATERVSGLETENSTLRAQLLVHELAGDHNANPTALLDSRRFMDTLTGLDPAGDNYRDEVATAIKSAVDKNTTLRAGQGSRRGGAEHAGGAGGNGTVTQEQFDAMDYKSRAALFSTNPTLYRQLAGTAT